MKKSMKRYTSTILNINNTFNYYCKCLYKFPYINNHTKNLGFGVIFKRQINFKITIFLS